MREEIPLFFLLAPPKVPQAWVGEGAPTHAPLGAESVTAGRVR